MVCRLFSDERLLFVKYKGKSYSNLYEVVLVIPRQERIVDGEPQEDIVLKFRPVSDWTEFNELCPQPRAPKIMEPGKAARPVTPEEDPSYAAALNKYANLQSRWMILQSISATTDMVFETVDMKKPETWENFEKELLEAGFNIFEINKIYETATQANILTDSALQAAKERFLASEQERQRASRSPGDVQLTTPYGEPAKDSESSPKS